MIYLFICLGKNFFCYVYVMVSGPYFDNRISVYVDDHVSLYMCIILILHNICFE